MADNLDKERLKAASKYLRDNAEYSDTEEYQRVLKFYRQAAHSVVAEPETTQNPLAGAGQSALRFGGNLLSVAEQVGDVAGGAILLNRVKAAQEAGDTAEAQRLLAKNPFANKGVAGQVSDTLKEASQAGPQFESAVSLDDINPANVRSLGDAARLSANAGRFIFDNTVASAPEGLAIAIPGVGAPAVAVAAQERIANERAERDGRGQATAADKLIAAPAAAANVALGRFGVKGAGAFVDDAAEAGIKASAKEIGRGAGREALTGAAQGAIEEGASGIGTEQGTSVEQITRSAIEEGLIGAGGGLAASVHREGGKVFQAAVDRRQIGEEAYNDTQRLQALQFARQAIEAERENVGKEKAASSPRGDAILARTAAKRAASELTRFVKGLKSDQKGQANQRALSELVAEGEQVINADPDALGEFDGSLNPIALALNSSARIGQIEIDKIKQLGLDEATTDGLVRALLVVDELSAAGIARNASRSPSQSAGETLGATVGGAAGVNAGLQAGSGLLGFAALGPAGGLVGRSVGGSIARGVDFALGRSTPDVVYNAGAVDRVLARRGAEGETIAESQARAREAQSTSSDLIRQRREQLQRADDLRREAEKAAEAAQKEETRLKKKREAAEQRAQQKKDAQSRRDAQDAAAAERRARQERVRALKEATEAKKALDRVREIRLEEEALEAGELPPELRIREERRARLSELRKAAREGTTPNPLTTIKAIRSLQEVDLSEARERENANRIEQRRQDPEGRFTQRFPLAPNQGIPFDGLVMNALRPYRKLGLNTGPAGQDQALAIALEKGLVTKEDVTLFNTDPKALMAGKRGFYIIDMMKSVYDDVARKRGLIEQPQEPLQGLQ